VRSVGAEIRGILSAIGRDVAPLRDRPGDVGEIAASVGRHVTAASEAVADLARVGACPVGELPRHSDVADVLRSVVKADAARAARHDVTVELAAPDDLHEVVQVGALTVLLHVLLHHAISASPPGSKVKIALAERDEALVVTFDDAGPTLPESARLGLLSRDFEVLATGRPTGMGLIAAHTIAAHLRAPLEIEDGPHGGARVRLTVPRGVM
jgi:signal transduction histidine kinase